MCVEWFYADLLRSMRSFLNTVTRLSYNCYLLFFMHFWLDIHVSIMNWVNSSICLKTLNQVKSSVGTKTSHELTISWSPTLVMKQERSEESFASISSTCQILMFAWHWCNTNPTNPALTDLENQKICHQHVGFRHVLKWVKILKPCVTWTYIDRKKSFHTST